MKAKDMTGTPALILTQLELEQLAAAAGKAAAEEVVRQLREELKADPFERHVERLRAYLMEPELETAPETLWASSRHIRAIELSAKGKPKSVGWFQGFKRDSGLGQCNSRPSPEHARSLEWRFTDIRAAWHLYYAFK